MLKKFFISMLGTMAALWISLFLLFFVGIMFAVSLASDEDPVKIRRHTILQIDLSGVVEERQQPATIEHLMNGDISPANSLDEMLRALHAAAYDERIDAVFLNCQGASMGYASRQELLQAIQDYKVNSGKPVYAYADGYSQGDFILASAADSVFLNPLGELDIHGIGGSSPFFKNALNKLGVKMQIVKVGTFKSAVEPFILTSMSEPARLQAQQYIDSLWSFSSDAIAEGRSIEADTIRTWASQLMFTMPASTLVDRNLVDALVYRRQMDDKLRVITNQDSDEELRTVSVTDYLADVTDIADSDDDHVAVYYAFGDIVNSGNSGIVGDVVAADIVSLADDDDVCGLVLRVNSPGGSAYAAEQIWDALQYFKSKNKPLYVSMGDYAASGGYYISSCADKIYADQTTITGSIGVFGVIPDLSGLITDKLGVDFSTVESNANAAGISITEPMTPEQYAAMQRSVEYIYDTFTSHVAQGRSLPIDSVRAIAEGRVWIGGRAQQLGLVDELGGLRTAVRDITAELGLDQDCVVAYPATDEDYIMTILRSSLNSETLSAAKPMTMADSQTREYIDFVRSLRNLDPIQARMERTIIE